MYDVCEWVNKKRFGSKLYNPAMHGSPATLTFCPFELFVFVHSACCSIFLHNSGSALHSLMGTSNDTFGSHFKLVGRNKNKLIVIIKTAGCPPVYQAAEVH